MANPRKLPRPFSLHWGSGQITEEATFEGEHHVPTIQLLDFSEGDGAGSSCLRFCFYDHRGRFMRDPLILSETELESMREALARAPRLKALLRRLVE